MKKRFDLSKLDFVEFDEYKPKFVFTDTKGEKHQIEMTTDSAHAGVSLFACLMAIEKHLAKE